MIRGIWARCWALSYIPGLKQSLFHRSRKAQIRGLWAPNQRGKTTSGTAEILSWGFGEDLWTGEPIERVGKTLWRPAFRFFIGAKDYNAGFTEVILPKLEEMLPLKELGVEYINMSGKVTHKLKFPDPYNFSIKMLSYEQDLHKNEGATWNGGWFDEPPPYHLYVSCRRGCLRHAAPIIFTGTPINEPWMYEALYNNAKAVTVDNDADLKHLKWNSIGIVKIRHDEYPPGVTKEQIDEWAETLDEEEKQARIYGEFMHLQGRIYKQFDKNIHVIERDELLAKHPDWRTYPAFMTVDPHDRKPFACAWGFATPRDEVIFIDEWPNVDFVRQKSWRWSTDEYLEMFRERETVLWGHFEIGHGDRFTWRLMDPRFGRSSKAGTGKTLEEEFADRGLYFTFPSATGQDGQEEIETGHMKVKTDLKEKRIFVTSNCKNIIKGFDNYVWDEFVGKNDRSVKEKPRDKYKDFMDVVRYTVMGDVQYIDHKRLAPRQLLMNNGLGL